MAITSHEMPDCLPFGNEQLVLGRFLGSRGAGSPGKIYEIWTTDAEHSEAIEGIHKNQHKFAEHHSEVCPNLELSYEQWRQTLSCGGVQDYIRKGVVVLRAMVIHSPVKCEIIGYISGDAKPAHLHLNHFSVLPQYRGQGVGRLLFDAFLKYFGNSRDIRLEVYLGNTAVHSAYVGWGFQPVKSTKRLTHMKLGKGAIPQLRHGGRHLDEVHSFLYDVQNLAGRICGLHCSIQSLAKQLEHFRSDTAGLRMLSDRFVGEWVIEDCRGVWGKAYIGPLNVGWLMPSNPDQNARELRISGVGTESKPFTLNAGEATVIQQEGGVVTWALNPDGQTKWTLAARGGLVPHPELLFSVPVLDHAYMRDAVQHQMQRLADCQNILRLMLQKSISPEAKGTFSLKPRTDALSSILDTAKIQLDKAHNLFLRNGKRKADVMGKQMGSVKRKS